MERIASVEKNENSPGKKIFWGIFSLVAVAVILFFGIVPLLKLAGSIIIILVIAFLSLVVLFVVAKILWNVFTAILGFIGILFAVVALFWLIERFF